MEIIETQGVVGSPYPDASDNTWGALEVVEEVDNQVRSASGASTVNYKIIFEYPLSPIDDSLEAGFCQLSSPTDQGAAQSVCRSFGLSPVHPDGDKDNS